MSPRPGLAWASARFMPGRHGPRPVEGPPALVAIQVSVDDTPVGGPGAQITDDAARPGGAVPERGFSALDRLLEDQVRGRFRVDLSHVDSAAPLRVVHGRWSRCEEVGVDVVLAHGLAREEDRRR